MLTVLMSSTPAKRIEFWAFHYLCTVKKYLKNILTYRKRIEKMDLTTDLQSFSNIIITLNEVALLLTSARLVQQRQQLRQRRRVQSQRLPTTEVIVRFLASLFLQNTTIMLCRNHKLCIIIAVTGWMVAQTCCITQLLQNKLKLIVNCR